MDGQEQEIAELLSKIAQSKEEIRGLEQSIDEARSDKIKPKVAEVINIEKVEKVTATVEVKEVKPAPPPPKPIAVLKAKP